MKIKVRSKGNTRDQSPNVVVDKCRRNLAKAAWVAPVVTAITLPLHAQTSATTTSSPTTTTTTTMPPDNRQPVRVINTQAELTGIDGRLAGLFQDFITVEVETLDGNWVPTITLPASVPENSVFKFRRSSTFSVTLMVGGRAIDVLRNEEHSFTFQGGQWV